MIEIRHILKSDFILNSLFVLTGKLTTRISAKYFLITLLFLLFYPVLFYFLSIHLNVWTGIEYPLSESYTTYLGDLVLGFVSISIISFYLHIPKAINNLIKKDIISKKKEVLNIFNEMFFNKGKHIFFLIILSLVISLILHLTWWLDDVHGWTESEIGKPNLLGIIHFFLHFFMTYIILTFIWNIYRLRKLLKIYKSKIFGNELVFNFDNYCSKKCGGFVDFSSLFLKGLTPIIILSVYMTITIFTLINYANDNDIEIWIILQFIFAVLGYILIIYFISNGIIKPINDILIRHRNQELLKLSKVKTCSNYLKKTTKCIEHHKFIEIISSYPVTILNKQTLISPKSLRIIIFIISQIIIIIYKLKQ